MIAEQLKKSILQAAIQGKLTQQLAEDGDAKDLLKEIQKEKARLIKEGKIKKEKPLPAITEEEIPFEIPENWCWVRLGEVFNIARGGSPRPIQDFITTNDKGINWIKISDSDIGGKYINQTKEKIKPEGLKKSRLVNSGDLLLTNSMSFGRPYILNITGCIHDGWLVLSPFSERVDKDYFYHLLSSEFIHIAFANTVAGAVVKNLNSDKVRIIEVPLPPVVEQKRIVERIEELLAEIESLKNDETKLEELQKSFPKKMKDAILQYAIQGKLTQQLPEDGDARNLLKEIQKEKARLINEGKIKKEKPLPEITEDEIPFEIPENWCWVRLGEIVTIQTGATFKKEEAQNLEKENVRILRGGNIADNNYFFYDNDIFLSPSIVKKDIYLRMDDLIMPSVTSLENVGKIARIANRHENIACGGFVFLLRLPSYFTKMSSFLCYCIQVPTIRDIIKSLTNKSGQAFYNLSAEKLKRIIIPLPPIDKQQQIVEILDKIMIENDKLSNYV